MQTHSCRQTDIHADEQTYVQTDIHADRYTCRQTEIHNI